MHFKRGKARNARAGCLQAVEATPPAVNPLPPRTRLAYVWCMRCA